MLLFTVNGTTGTLRFYTNRNPSVHWNNTVHNCMNGKLTLDNPTNGRGLRVPINLANQDLLLELARNQRFTDGVILGNSMIIFRFNPNAGVEMLGQQRVIRLTLFFEDQPGDNMSSELQRVRFSARPAPE